MALSRHPTIRNFQCPQYSDFKLTDGRSYDAKKVRDIIKANQKHTLGSALGFSVDINREVHQRVMDSLESALQKQFPTNSPRAPDSIEIEENVDTSNAMVKITPLFKTWTRNHELHAYLTSIVQAAANMPRSPHDFTVYSCTSQSSQKTAHMTHLSTNNLFTKTWAPAISCQVPDTMIGFHSQSAHIEEDRRHLYQPRQPLQSLIESLRVISKEPHETQYVEELQQSFESFQAVGRDEPYDQPTLDADVLLRRLQTNLSRCLKQVESFQEIIFSSFDHQGQHLVPHSRHFCPRLSPVFLLQQLNKNHWPNLPGTWRSCVTKYALSLTHLQRAQRMLDAVGNRLDLMREAANVGHSWDLKEFPESLLMEVESGLIIRDVQNEVAVAMRESDGNRVMQLNMGEGKSSVIVQVVAASLADGERIVRIIVAKPQSKQMRYMLVTKLGGLLNRRVFFLPFSRSKVMDQSKVDQIQAQLETCRRVGGVLLVQPEELLSFKLMGIEQFGSHKHASKVSNDSTTHVGRKLIDSQKYLDQHSRDIIDESDENFSVNFELVYTIGTQRPSEMSPDRWIVIQHVLGLIARVAPDISALQPEGIQLHPGRTGQFATLRFLREESGHMLLQTVARHIRDNGCYRLPMSHQSQVMRDSVFTYITQFDVDPGIIKRVEATKNGFFNDMTKNVILLLRGLFAHGILAFAFGQKRWRVNYGLTTRVPPTMLAVPYRAKDSPAPRAEFSHPDVVILLTCLSYYYGGLSDAQMDTVFEHLERSDQSSTVYGEWIAGSPSLDIAFHQLSGVNRKDRSQCLKHVYPALKHTKAVVDFYLAKVVFPKYCMEFPKKLSASGWDLAKARPQAVTGFSGTCDSKYVLPTDISHVNLPSQMHTSATVLNNPLRSENTVELLGPNLDGEALLKAVVNSNTPIQVILDVGALIVDLENDEVARRWLELTPLSEKEAVIFLNRDDEMLVMDRNGFTEPFLTSSFAANTDSCFIFLDEAHTRGIDLKLPGHYRAATTLGPKLTKDRLVQACMRMRKLGQGQSVVFFIPKEIQDKISAVTSRQISPNQVLDVLSWSISETWVDTRKSGPLWVMQGLRHQRQEAIWANKIKDRDTARISEGYLKDYFEEEGMGLEQRYAPVKNYTRKPTPKQLERLCSSGRAKQVELIQDKCEQLGVAAFASASLQEEQERELAPEIEQERQIEKPTTAEPERHVIYASIMRMVTCGELRIPGTHVIKAFDALRSNGIPPLAVVNGFGQNLLVTVDFNRTVQLVQSSSPDAFHRPVQWVLTFKNPPASQFMVILSPFEANALLPEIEKSPYVLLHLYLPRADLSLPSLQHLNLHTIPAPPPGWEAPRDLVLQLNLFAGQLYFDNFDDYKATCAYLGLSYTPNQGDSAAALDGFVGQTQYPGCSFTRSPTSFLQFIMANVRRDRQDISKTHVGRMLAGEILTEDDFPSLPQ